ncbi:hypothetical protein tb265_12720 [Gemmatimonadetes bacterium T265]|nr:hypothetical protein tb265_12720 [Gemmatimonadetes bacterium T265]
MLDGRSALGAGGAPTPLAGPSAFTLEAWFDAAGPNLAAPVGVPGFVAYTPSALQLTIGGRTYAVQASDAAHPTGLAVAIFDPTTPFGPPGRYGVGVIQNPLADGAGIVADFTGATPGFAVSSGGLVPTTFTGYAGVGVSSGVCLVGAPGSCQTLAVTPIPLTWDGQSFALTFGNYSDDAPGTPAYAASIAAVPEPGTVALLAAGLGAAAACAGARRRGARA